MDIYSIMVETVRNHQLANMVYLSWIKVVGNKGVQCCLGVIPMEPLGSILQNKRVIFGKIYSDQELSHLQDGRAAQDA